MENVREEKRKKEAEFEEKYADIINDLGVKYNTPDGVDYLKAIARAKILQQEPMYEADIEFNLDEVVADYKEILALSAILNDSIGIN